MTTSVVDTPWTTALVPVQLTIILVVSTINISSQGLPPISRALRESIFSDHRGGGRLAKHTLEALVRVQQNRLITLEAEMVEKQRALQANAALPVTPGDCMRTRAHTRTRMETRARTRTLARARMHVRTRTPHRTTADHPSLDPDSRS